MSLLPYVYNEVCKKMRYVVQYRPSHHFFHAVFCSYDNRNKKNKCSAVSEMADDLATISGVGSNLQVRGHNAGAKCRRKIF